MKVQLADVSHLKGIMEIEEETYGALGIQAMAPRSLMESRINRCNVLGAGWYFTAIHDGEVVGYMILQPTRLSEEDCVSWEVATDSGTFEKTYDEDGDTIFAVSLGARRNSPPGAISLLFYHGLVSMIKRNKKRAIFCSRMPSLSHAMVQNGVDPENYCFMVDSQGKPIDWLLREFYEVLGILPRRFLPNGYPPDAESAGHGAQMVLEDFFLALETSLYRTYQSGIAHGRSLQKRRVKHGQ